MNINFFEEFPTKANLYKLKMVSWSPCTLFLACHSIDDFKNLKRLAQKLNPLIEVGWWPTVKNSYWISPWSDPDELLRISNELTHEKKIRVLIDLEPPIMNKMLFLKNSFRFWNNRQKIKQLIGKQNRNIDIYTAELPPRNNLQYLLLKKFGLIYPQIKRTNYKRILMLYSSMPLFNPQMKIKIEQLSQKDKRIEIGLGLIARGIFGNESLLSPRDLFKDLNWCKKAGFNNVTIFRLGGLNQKYLGVIKKFI